MAKKSSGFIPTLGGKFYPRSVGQGVPNTPDMTKLEKDTVRRIREQADKEARRIRK